jgi:hypothetical protein
MVCKQCGETYFTPAAHDLVLKLVTSDTPPLRVASLNLFDAQQQSARFVAQRRTIFPHLPEFRS